MALNTAELYTIGWIAALAHELAAGISMLDERHRVPSDFVQNARDGNSYTWGRMRNHNIVIASLPAGEYGTHTAAITAQSMLASIPWLRFGLLVGIGAGIPTAEADIRLGDVVVSVPGQHSAGVIQYDHLKAKEGKLHLSHHLDKTPRALRTAVAALQAQHEMEESRIPEILAGMLERNPKMAGTCRKPGYVHQGSAQDQFYRDGKLVERQPRETSVPEIHYGTIASGNVLIKDTRERDAILQRLNVSEQVICFEMEAAGLMNDFPCLVIRGICDYADEHKNDLWQRYAAATAASYAKELLTHVDATEVHRTPHIIHSIKRDSQRILATVQNLQQTSASSAISSWLDPPDPSTNYHRALDLRHPGTGDWLLQSTYLAAWREQVPSFLLLHGIQGCGKTILSTTVIQHLQNDCSGMPLLYFYFDFSDSKKQTVDNMIRSLIYQSYRDSAPREGAYIPQLLERYAFGHQHSDMVTLLSAFTLILDSIGPVRIVLDALDECTTRTALLQWIRGLLGAETKNVQIFATSCEKQDGLSAMTQVGRTEQIVAIPNDAVDHDINLYVRAQIFDPHGKLRRWMSRPSVQEEILAALVKKANGMFRWAFCQLDALSDCLDIWSLREALATLPETLTSTYDRILQGVPRRQKERVVRLLQFLTYSERPLSLDEAVDAVAVSLEQNAFSKDNRFPDPSEIISHCSSLVLIVEQKEPGTQHDARLSGDGRGVQPPKELQLAHLSVREYLTSTKVESGFREAMSDISAHSSIARVTLLYLIGLDCSLTSSQIVQDFPFSLYAAEFGIAHAAKLNGRDSVVESLIIALFDRESQTYATWIALHNPDRDQQLFPFTNWTSSAAGALPSPLYFASLMGLTSCASHLLSTGLDVNARGGTLGNALQAASHEGQLELVDLLLKHGAHVNAEDGYSVTALRAASRRGHESVVRKLLDSNAEIDFMAENGQTALHLAAKENRVDCVQLLLERSARSSIDDDNMTPFLYAIENSSENMAESILKAEPDSVNLSVERRRRRRSEKGLGLWTLNSQDMTPLHYAVLSANSRMVRYLLSKGADINASSKAGKTALHFCVNPILTDQSEACLEGADMTASIIVPYEDRWTRCRPEAVLDFFGPDPYDAQTEQQYHQLKTEIEETRNEVLKILVGHRGIDLDAKDERGQSAVHYLTSDRLAPTCTMLSTLCDQGADLQLRDNQGTRPIQQALAASNLGAAQMLVGREVDLSVVDDEGSTIVHYAARSGDSATITYAIDVLKHASMASIMMKLDIYKRNPLHVLLGRCEYVDETAADMLVKSGIDVNQLDVDGHSPLATYLVEPRLSSPDRTIINLLLEAGAAVADFKDSRGRNLLHLAANKAPELSLDVVKILESAGVRPVDHDADGRTVIHHSALGGNLVPEVLQHFESLELQRDLPDQFGKTAWDYAYEKDKEFRGTWVFDSERWAKVMDVLMS